jgi:hypothetical protein
MPGGTDEAIKLLLLIVMKNLPSNAARISRKSGAGYRGIS